MSKLLAMVLMSGIILFFILLPIKVSNYVESKGERGKLFLSACTCFGGGVFLGMYMLHISPEVRAMLEESLLTPNSIVYPVPEIIAGCGFFGILFFEYLIHYFQAKGQAKESQGQSNVSSSQIQVLDASELDDASKKSSYSLATVENGVGDSRQAAGPDSVSTTGSTTSNEKGLAAQVRAIILMVALSADCVFEGMAVGLKYDVAAVWTLFIAVIGHEFIVSFCLGMELVRSQKTTLGVVLSGSFYAATPAIGVAIGIAIFEAGGENSNIQTVNGVLQALAAGIFLYCTFLGLLAEELGDRSKLLLLVMVLIGYILMASLAAIPSSTTSDPDTTDTTTMATN